MSWCLCGCSCSFRDQFRTDGYPTHGPSSLLANEAPTVHVMRLSDFDDWARGHHGIITLDASGLSRDAWYRAIKAGTIEQIHPHVARLHGTPDTAEQRIIAAVFAVGAGAIASHRSAARLWGIPRPDDDPVDVLLPQQRRDVHLDGVVVHRPRDLARLIPQRRFSIPCTNILRTLLDLGAVDPSSLHDAVGHAITTELAALEALDAAAAEHARPGRGGVVAVRDAIADWSIDGKPTDSMLEAAFDRLALRYGLPALDFHPVIERHRGRLPGRRHPGDHRV